MTFVIREAPGRPPSRASTWSTTMWRRAGRPAGALRGAGGAARVLSRRHREGVVLGRARRSAERAAQDATRRTAIVTTPEAAYCASSRGPTPSAGSAG